LRFQAGPVPAAARGFGGGCDQPHAGWLVTSAIKEETGSSPDYLRAGGGTADRDK